MIPIEPKPELAPSPIEPNPEPAPLPSQPEPEYDLAAESSKVEDGPIVPTEKDLELDEANTGMIEIKKDLVESCDDEEEEEEEVFPYWEHEGCCQISFVPGACMEPWLSESKADRKRMAKQKRIQAKEWNRMTGRVIRKQLRMLQLMQTLSSSS